MRSDGGQKKPAQKNPEGKKCGQEIWVGTKAQAQSPSYGTYYVIENMLLLKINKTKILEKPRRGWFVSLDDEHVTYAALYTPDMATHGAPSLVPRPCCISCRQNIKRLHAKT